MSTDVTDSAQPAELQWRAYQQLIAIPVLDAGLNQGLAGVVNLVRVKEEIAFGSMLMKLNRAVQRTSPQNTSIDLDGVPLALATSGTYAGITIQNNATTGFQWMSNGGSGPTTMAAAPGSSGAALNLAGVQGVYGQCAYGNEEPTLIITTQNAWNAYWNLLMAQQRYIEDEETTRGGFRNLMFNRAVMLHDQFVPSGQLQMFTEKYVRPIFHPSFHFRIEPYIMPTNQYVAISRVYVVMQLQFLGLRQHGLITAISNG